jgi:hypothetical protein
VTGLLFYGVVAVADVPHLRLFSPIESTELGCVRIPETIGIGYDAKVKQRERGAVVLQIGQLLRSKPDVILARAEHGGLGSDVAFGSDLDRFLSGTRIIFVEIIKCRLEELFNFLPSGSVIFSSPKLGHYLYSTRPGSLGFSRYS